MHSLARNHAFVDGNKRVAFLTAGAFYWANGYQLDVADDPAYGFVIGVATGEIDVPEMAETWASWVTARA